MNTSTQTSSIPKKSVINKIRSDLAETENDENHKILPIRCDIEFRHFSFFELIFLRVEEHVTFWNEKQADEINQRAKQIQKKKLFPVGKIKRENAAKTDARVAEK